jgi:hypothetical protein
MQKPDTRTAKTFTPTNSGDALLSIDGAFSFGAPNYDTGEDLCTGATLTLGQTCTYVVVFDTYGSAAGY